MTTILIAFFSALFFSVVLTPVAGRIGLAYGAIDRPGERKVHARPIPRSGGLAIFASFFLSIVIVGLAGTLVSDLLELERKFTFLTAGCALVFSIGLADDFKRLGPMTKFVFQVAGASLAYLGGARVSLFHPDNWAVAGAFDYGSTVLWFILLINAVNLIDGLDGLASGVVFFACTMMVILSTIGGRYLSAMLFAALGGSVLGFLRYNFNPASVFMGDSGSYFLGYAVAAISVLESTKAQMGAALLIPVLGLGVPIFDTMLSPLRRFVRGKKMFIPDQGHVHHRLMKMGLNQRRIVLTLYGISILLCLSALFAVNIRDEQAGLFMLVMGVACVFFIRKLGYFEYLASDKIYGWFRDISEEAGLSRERRSFLDIQLDIGASENWDAMWENACRALEKLQFDFAEMKLYVHDRSSCRRDPLDGCKTDKGVACSRDFSWKRTGFDSHGHLCRDCLFKLELPLLIDRPSRNFGVLWLVKDLSRDPISHYTLRRVEHLRRSIVESLCRECNKPEAPEP